MKPQQILIPDSLKDCVQSFWRLEDGYAESSEMEFKTIADGCPGFIFQHPDKGTLCKDDKLLPAAFLFGQASKHATLNLRGNMQMIGIFFYPNALKNVFGLDAGELTDSCMDMNDFSGNQGFKLSEELLNSRSEAEQIKRLSSFLLSQKQKNEVRKDDKIAYALSAMLSYNGNVSLPALTGELNISERNFERKFKEYVGLSPKLFCRISRFQASLKQLKLNDYNKLSDIAYENDYADQSHFIRSFKEFAGFSPYQYRKQSNEVADNLARIIK